MKKKSLVLMSIIVMCVSTTFAQDARLTVDISGIEKVEGRVAVGLFNQAEDFPKIDQAYQGVFLKITRGNVHHVFSDIPVGTYAVAVFHDINDNGKLDKNFLGIPKEGYAFSNDVKGSFGPPSFDDAKFELRDEYTAGMKMNY